MDNIDYFESIDPQEEEALSARNRVRLLAKHVCSRFEPFKEYFGLLPIAKITHSRPDFTATVSHSLRDNLQPHRQVKYLRGMLSQDYCQQALQEMLNEEQHKPIKKLRNSIVVKGDMVYWAHETVIKQAKIKDFMVREVIQGKEHWSVSMAQPKILIDLHEWIYELAVVEDNLYARTPRAMISVAAQSGAIVGRVGVNEQLINWHHTSKNGAALLLTTYQSRISQLYEHSQQRMQLWCKLDGLVHSMWSKSAAEVVLCKESAILVGDRRRKMVHQLHRRPKVHQNRIYAAISLAETVLGSRYFATTQSFHICIYDLRRPHEPILKMAHFCEEAPPSIMQTWSSHSQLKNEPTPQDFDAFVTASEQWRDESPLLIAHSPYQNGSSLFTELDIKWQNPQQLLNLQFNGQTNQFANKLRLLYDSGKLQQHYHPRGIASFLPMKGQIGFFHLDNFDGITLQIMERVAANHGLKGYKASAHNFVYQRVNMGMQQSVQELQPANQEWFIGKNMERQIQVKNEDHWTQYLDNQEQLELQEAKFEERVVRFADLKHFYHRVHEQAHQLPLNQRVRQEEASALKNSVVVPEVRGQATQSQTQKEQVALGQGMKVGRLSEQAITELLDEWHSS